MAAILPQSGEPFILNGRTGLVKAGSKNGASEGADGYCCGASLRWAGEGARPSMALAEGGESILW